MSMIFLKSIVFVCVGGLLFANNVQHFQWNMCDKRVSVKVTINAIANISNGRKSKHLKNTCANRMEDIQIQMEMKILIIWDQTFDLNTI